MGPPESAASGARGIGEPGRSDAALLPRHAAKCRICNHPDRHAIEFDFLNWRNPADLARSYNLRDITTIYRHAHATGLFSKRRLNLRFALERIVERVNEVPVTATAVIRAARALTRINDAGEWIDPPARFIVTHVNGEESVQPERPKPSKIDAVVKSRPAPAFDAALLDEPSLAAESCGEMPKLPHDAPREIVLTLEPELQKARIARWEAIEADRKARAEQSAAFIERMRQESDARLAASQGAPGPEEPAALSGHEPRPSPPATNAKPKNSSPLIANETHSRGKSNDRKLSHLQNPDRK